MNIALLVNPIAGMGGSVGLKGTDNLVKKAIDLGAKARANENAKKALKEISSKEHFFYTGSHVFGEDILKELGFNYEKIDLKEKNLEEYSDEESRQICEFFNDKDIDILLFAGGDGTARTIIKYFKKDIVVIGIPTGVKMQSAVFALRANIAGRLADRWLNRDIKKTKLAEVIDLDEDEYRNNKISSSLYGYLKVPDDPKRIQNRKSASAKTEEASQRSIAIDLIDKLKEKTLYFIGPGTSTNQVLKEVNLHYTLLGIDLLLNGKIIENDLNENRILHFLERYKGYEKKLLLSPIGGQGMIIGRGNQQISAEVLKQFNKDDLIILASKNKIAALKGAPFYIDSSDNYVDEKFAGYYKVIVSYNQSIMYKLS